MELRAAMVCVDYEDLLAVTLPYNRHHFADVLIVTDFKHESAVRDIALPNDAKVIATDAFYARGASFNKWAALEWALDVTDYRHGWLCLMDADVLWPKKVQVNVFGESLRFGWEGGDLLLNRGELMTPLRRMCPWPQTEECHRGQLLARERTKEGYVIPSEQSWGKFAIHKNVAEWAGYSQVFHATDPHLPKTPWHEVDWKHAGGADSIFQRNWPNTAKRRPQWEVLHLGEAGANWYGRATQRADGSIPPEAPERAEQVNDIWRGRAEKRARGLSEAERFRPEKLGGGNGG